MNRKGDEKTDFDAFVKRQQPIPEEGEPIDWAKDGGVAQLFEVALRQN